MLKFIKKAIGYVLEVAGLRVPGATAGQVLVADADGVFTPGAGGGGGSLPVGTNGGILAHAGGAWASTSAGYPGHPLVSNGASGVAFSGLVAPLAQTASDAATSAVSVCGYFSHNLPAHVGAAGIGARCVWRVTNAGGDLAPIAALDAVAIDTTADSEHGVVDVMLVAGAGSEYVRSARFWPAGVSLGGVTVAVPADAGVSLAWASRSIVLRDSAGGAWLDVWRVDGGNCWVFGSANTSYSGGTYLQAPSNGEISLRRASTNHVFVNSSGAITIGTISHTTAIQGTSVTLAGLNSLQIGYTSVVAVYVGGARVPETTINASVTLDASNEVVFVDTTSGAVTVTLPAGASGRVIAVQRIAGSNNVVVQRAGSDTIRANGTSGTSWTISDDSRHGLIYRSAATQWVAES